MAQAVRTERSVLGLIRPRNRVERQALQHATKSRLRPRFISIREACDYLNISRAKFYKDLQG